MIALQKGKYPNKCGKQVDSQSDLEKHIVDSHADSKKDTCVLRGKSDLNNSTSNKVAQVRRLHRRAQL